MPHRYYSVVAAERAMTGDNANDGRTLPESVAMAFGKGLPLANLMLAGVGYSHHGEDESVPDIFRAQSAQDPLMFAFATHGFKGIASLLGAEDGTNLNKLLGRKCLTP